jgi:hypothetical protein
MPRLTTNLRVSPTVETCLSEVSSISRFYGKIGCMRSRRISSVESWSGCFSFGTSISLSTPQVFKFDIQCSSKALDGLTNTQLTENEVAHLKSTGHSPVEVVEGEVRSPTVEPGHATVGVVGVKLPVTHGRTVLHLVFPDYGADQLTATLVL